MEKSSGLGLPAILFIVFLILKLTDNIDWSWWWVTSPLWIPVALALALVCIVFSVAIVVILVALSFGVSIDQIKEKASSFTKK